MPHGLLLHFDMLYWDRLMAFYNVLLLVGNKWLLVCHICNWFDVLLCFCLALLDCFTEIVNETFCFLASLIIELEVVLVMRRRRRKFTVHNWWIVFIKHWLFHLFRNLVLSFGVSQTGYWWESCLLRLFLNDLKVLLNFLTLLFIQLIFYNYWFL